MGAKSSMRDEVLQLLSMRSRAKPSLIVDLFSGAGTVSGWMSDGPNILAVDALNFPLAISRARFLNRPESFEEAFATVVARARALARKAEMKHAELLWEEAVAVGRGWKTTFDLITEAEHVGNNQALSSRAVRAKREQRYDLARLYFSRGYFSTRQAIALDAIRRAIDECFEHRTGSTQLAEVATHADVALAAWISTASSVANSPGHVAQFLKSANPESFRRVRRAWTADVFNTFTAAITKVSPLGSRTWREGNSVQLGDAIEISNNSRFADGAIFYADPPYTKDHYSRMYHVLETLYLYDYPDSNGAGRTRSTRHLSDFSFASRAPEAFSRLAEAVANQGAPLVVSYPAGGLVGEQTLTEILGAHGKLSKLTRAANHSSLGGSSGRGRVPAIECLYRVDPPGAQA